MRNLRRDANEHLKKLLKDKLATEDDERRAQDEVQRLTDRVIAEIDRLMHAKEAEILARLSHGPADRSRCRLHPWIGRALPRHVAIVMDGNGRWAKKRYMPRFFGHKQGVDALVRAVQSLSLTAASST